MLVVWLTQTKRGGFRLGALSVLGAGLIGYLLLATLAEHGEVGLPGRVDPAEDRQHLATDRQYRAAWVVLLTLAGRLRHKWRHILTLGVQQVSRGR